MGEMSFRDRASLLLGGLEEGREVRAYLRRFSQSAEGCFAVVKVGGAVIERDLDPLADALALLQFLGLPPVVVFGAGPQLDKDLASAGIEEKRVDGLRFTPQEAMPIVAQAAGRMALTLTGAMRERGAAAVAVHQGTISARLIDHERYGAVGNPVAVDAEGLSELLAAGVVPLLSCVHADERGQLLNVNADGVARAVAEALRPQKIVFVTGTGGLLGADGEIIDSVNLRAEGEDLFASSWLEGGMRHKLKEIADLLGQLPPSSSVSVTSATGVVRELFTHTGSGTLIRQGEAIERLDHADASSFGPLIEAGFGKALKTSYWQDLDPRYALLSEQKRAGAVVCGFEGVDLLDKFAVSGEARGEGLAKALWQRLTDLSPQLIWRSRTENPFNAFYVAHADGFVRRGKWSVFWTGPGVEARIEGLADRLAARPGDFEGEE